MPTVSYLQSVHTLNKFNNFNRNKCTPDHSCNYQIGQWHFIHSCCNSTTHKILQIQIKPFGLCRHLTSVWEYNVISVTLRVTLLLVPDRLVLIFLKLLMYSYFHTEQFIEFTKNGVVIHSSVHKNTLLMREDRGEIQADRKAMVTQISFFPPFFNRRLTYIPVLVDRIRIRILY